MKSLGQDKAPKGNKSNSRSPKPSSAVATDPKKSKTKQEINKSSNQIASSSNSQAKQNTLEITTKSGTMSGESGSKQISIEELMKAADAYANLSLAHEISIDNNFRIEKQEPPANSLERKIRDTLMQAFWDILKEELNATPPVYTQAIILLEEIKETLLSFLTPRNERTKKQIEEQLDIELIRQQLEHNAFDLKVCAGSVIDWMAKMCAPVRDEEIKNLRKIDEVVTLYREIFRILDLMKMDMANFTIAQMRPYIQQHAIEYEREKFKEFIKTQKKAGLDELPLTNSWLTNVFTKLESQSKSANSAAKDVTGTKPAVVTPYNIIIEACMEILDWPDAKSYPETLQMDENRFRTLREAVHHIILTQALVLVTANVLQQQGCSLPAEISSQLGQTLKVHIIALMRSVLTCHFSKHSQELSLQIVKDVNAALGKANMKPLTSSSESALNQQITDIVNGKNSVAALLKARLYEFIRKTAFCGNLPQITEVPNGFVLMEADIKEICGHFAHLFSHNRAVFGPIYAEILEPLVKPRPSSPTKSSC